MLTLIKPKTRMRRLLLTSSERAALAFLQDNGTMTGTVRRALRWAARYQPTAGQQRLAVLDIPKKAKRYGHSEFDLQQMLWRARPEDIEAIETVRKHYKLDTEQAAIRLAVRLAAQKKGFTPPLGMW